MSGIRPRRILFALAAAPLLAAFQTTATDAQFRVGGHGTYQTKFIDGTFGAGGRAEIDLAFLRDGLTLAGTYDHFFVDCENCRSFEVGGELLFGPGPLFVGAGAVLPERLEPGDDTPDAGIEPRMGVQHDRRDQVPAGTGGDPVRGVSAAARRQRQQPDVLRRRSGGPGEQAASPPAGRVPASLSATR